VFEAARQMAARMGTEGVKATAPRMLVAKSDFECRHILRKSVFDVCCHRHLVLKADEPVQSIARRRP
jgi:hypothetical protein